MGCGDSAGESRWYLPRCAVPGCNWDVNVRGEECYVLRLEEAQPTADSAIGQVPTEGGKDEIDAQTGGLHPAELCGEDCSGCCDEWEWK